MDRGISRARVELPDPKFRLFRDSYPTACGLGESAAGPFYRPWHQPLLLDLAFFDVMTRQLGAPGQLPTRT